MDMIEEISSLFKVVRSTNGIFSAFTSPRARGEAGHMWFDVSKCAHQHELLEGIRLFSPEVAGYFHILRN